MNPLERKRKLIEEFQKRKPIEPKSFEEFMTQKGVNWDFPKHEEKPIWENYYLSIPYVGETALCPVCGREFTKIEKYERHVDFCYRANKKIKQEHRASTKQFIVRKHRDEE